MGRAGTGLIWGLAAPALLAACSSQPASEQVSEEPYVQTHSEFGLRIIPVSVISGTGTHVFRTELAATPEQQKQGMMFRTSMGPDDAMLFPSAEPTARAFWMKNTPIPLDIIFVGLDGRISNIAAMAEPYSVEQIYSVGSVSAVLELAGGRAAELGIEPGDRVTWDIDE